MPKKRGSTLTTTVLMAGGLRWKLLETVAVTTVDLEVVHEVVVDLEADHTHHEEDIDESRQLATISATIVESTAIGQIHVRMEIGVTGAIGVEGTGI